MSREKPWKKPFAALLVELSAHFEGEIRNPEFNDMTGGWGVDPSHFVYPTFHFTSEHGPCRITVSEFPSSGGTIIDGADNWEFLNVAIDRPNPFKLSIRPEGWFDRFQKFIRLAHEFQTGRPEFDRKYMLNVETESDRSLLRDTELQQAVAGLEPFAALTVRTWGLECTRPINNASDLEFIAVRRFLEDIFRVAQTIGRHT